MTQHSDWLDAAAKELAAMVGPNEGWGMWRDWLTSILATRPAPGRDEVERAVEAYDAARDRLRLVTVMPDPESVTRPAQETMYRARDALLALYREPVGEEFKVMKVYGHESAVDPTGHPYIKAMLVITSDLSVDQGREFRVADGDRVRIVRVEEGAP